MNTIKGHKLGINAAFKKKSRLFITAIALSAVTACASYGPDIAPKTIAAQPLSAEQTLRAKRVDNVLQTLVSSGRVPGISLLIYEQGREIYYGQAGLSNIKSKTPLTREDVGRYYSMTKPIIGVGLMKLYEQGKFSLDDPVSKYLPEYKNLQVYAGKNADGGLKLTAPHRPITIRDLMRHTAGFTYGRFSNTPVDQLYRKAEILVDKYTVEEFSQRLGKLPLLVQPGKKWIYSVGVDVQGRLIEVLSGQKLGDYLQSQIFIPLGMTHTGFSVKHSDKAKFGPAYVYNTKAKPPVLFQLTDKNALAVTRGIVASIDNRFTVAQTFQSGGGGLVSTIDDYAKFALMLGNRGKGNGETILKAATLALMNHDQLGDIDNGQLQDGMGFGLDFAVKTAANNAPNALNIPVGSYYWGGLAGTYFWVDPSHDQVVIMHMQLINPLDPTMRTAVVNAVYGK